MPPTLGSLIALCVAALLLLCSGFVSASEIAFFSLSPADLNDIEEERHPSDAKIARLRSDSERLLATILIANNLVNVAIIMLLNYALMQIFQFGTEWVEFLLMTVVLTFLLLLFGEVMPKIYSAQHRLSFCRKAAPVFGVLNKLFYPVSSLLMRSRGLTERILAHEAQALTVDDLEQALELTDKEEIKEEKELKAGDSVRIKGLTSIGEIESTDGKMATVIFGGMRTKMRLERLEAADPASKQQSKTEERNEQIAGAYGNLSSETRQAMDTRKLNFRQDLDVRGMRGDEAVNAVMYFIDDALMVGMSRVRILHGTGSGILRQLIRQYLRTIPNVVSCRDEHVQFGGAGITVVELE